MKLCIRSLVLYTYYVVTYLGILKNPVISLTMRYLMLLTTPYSTILVDWIKILAIVKYKSKLTISDEGIVLLTTFCLNT